ncbi:MAG: hypothetical protein ACFE0Q_15390 [Anaerolineae bacterium]
MKRITEVKISKTKYKLSRQYDGTQFDLAKAYKLLIGSYLKTGVPDATISKKASQRFEVVEK